MDSWGITRYRRTVIRARGLLERGLATRWLGPWVALLLVLLVLLIGLHPVSDEFVHEAAFICAVVVLAGLVVLPLVGGSPRPSRTTTETGRPAPCPARSVAKHFLTTEPGSFPLRR